jgi:hypothetical protein
MLTLQLTADDGFTTEARKEIPTLWYNLRGKNRPPMIRVRSSSSVIIVIKGVKIKYRFSPDVWTTEIEKSLLE